ncbi:hypothetical protein [Alicyclobacillus dauci]|uniref:Basic membrane lipoprotein Med, substrate-binding protein (PBP1-ABC) superfamily n=1 Tax=Alicyclobacillus dauci TaxID=1475485 RepID=A0ABY6YYZ1_9BACL|nr:hypothetical protein [Alicyclobacillus dauci]WAH35346.1 hypothetical protein NZD86_13670 [Alicyclobacillus dauci]
MREKKITMSLCVLSLSLLMAGCGAPDLGAMRPHEQKQAAAVVVVDHPSFLSSSSLQSIVDTQTSVVQTVRSSANSFDQVIDHVLQNKDVTFCLVAANDTTALASDISQIAQKYSSVHFEILSTQAGAAIQGANVSTISQDENATAFSVGFVAGTWATNQAGPGAYAVQPTFGYLPNSLPTSVQQAFFAGLYTADPGAHIVPMTPLNGAALPPLYPTVSSVIVGSTPTQPMQQFLQTQGYQIFSLSPSLTQLKPVAMPGHIDVTHFTDALSQFSTGHWQNGNETVFDPTSLTLQSLPSSVVNAWSPMERASQQTPNLWKSDYQNLPQATRQSIRSQFGIA